MEKLGCCWCADQYDDISLLMGHAIWTHRSELLGAITRPLEAPTPTYGVPKCLSCQQREFDIDRAAIKHLRPSEVYAVTAFSHRKDGHVLFFSPLGEITLCQARKLELPVWAKEG